MALSTDEIVARVREVGACCIPDFLSASELEEAREALDRACAELGHGDQKAGERARLDGQHLMGYPGLARIFDHPRIIELSAILTAEPDPFLQETVANRYLPPVAALTAHVDENFGLVPPFMRVTWALFLDDIFADSGALQIVPGSHLLNYIDEIDPDKQPPTDEDVLNAEYVPIELKAGALILRASDLWHSVAPIHHLRRYVTGSYISRTRLSPWFKADLERQIAEQEAPSS